jgi:murein L,D-transpeptidase YcbB/YkuD
MTYDAAMKRPVILKLLFPGISAALWRNEGRQFAGLALCLIVGMCGGSGSACATESAPWFEGGRPSAQALQAVALLVDAAADGLEPRDYDATELQRAVATAAAGPAPEAAALTRLDAALTLALQRYLSDLHGGRIDPRQIHARFDRSPGNAFDPAATLAAALAQNHLPQAVHDAAPRLPLYAQLREVLAQYRALGEHAAWAATLPPLPGKKLEPAQAYAGLALLAQRLQALGDLAADAPVPERYEGALVAAIQSFQRRHGLADDGVIGKSTLAALDVTPAQRAHQIALSLERLRWTPLLQGPRMIVVNVPEFVLRAYEIRGDRVDIKLEMKVVVGRTLNTRTPLFGADMRFIEFSPYWNVPPSIARSETVPRLKRDPAYFKQQGFEFVGRDGKTSTTLDDAQLEAVLRGELRIRQRPGPSNALGDIKFVFPNNNDIYLHHTPTPQLFERDRRDFSHGCIRVQEPVELAKFVLQDQPDWTEARIHEAMDKGTSQTLRLDQPLPVLIVYVTALFKNGRPYFFADLYGHDRLLEQALRQRSLKLLPWPALIHAQ